MKILNSYEKAKSYIQDHSAEDERTRKRRLNPGPTITISRETGIGAVAIGERLIEYFNQRSIDGYADWTYFDKSLIEKVMEDHHLPEHFRKFIEDEKPAKLDSWFGEMLGISPSRLSLLKKTSQTISKLAEFGNVILVGRGANIITAKNSNTFHVRLIAPLGFRIETAMKLYNVDRKTATEFLKKEDEARKNYIQKYFHKNIEDPLLYHFIINTHLLNFEELAAMIGHCVMRRFPKYFQSLNKITIIE
jgi:cytidylate kinase